VTDVTRGAPRFDPYPTRFEVASVPPAIMRRRGPVIRGRAAELASATGIADAAERFDADGFLSLPSFFSPREAALWLDEARRLERWCQDTRPEEAFFERASGFLRSLFDPPRYSDQLAVLARHPRLTRIAAAIVGDEPYVHQSRLNYKPAYRGTGFYWHSDFETWHAEDGMPDMRAVSISIALRENNAFNGPLMLIAGSHRSFVPCIGATPDDHYRTSLISQRVGTPTPEMLDQCIAAGRLEMPTGPAGSVVVFDCNTLHASYNNLSPESRTNLFLVYNARSNALQAPFAARRCRPEFVAHRPGTTAPDTGPAR
jgi:ectoine hydroxylase